MAFAAVQTASAGAQSTASSRGITVSATTAGNLVYIASIVIGTTDTLSSVTDNASGGANTYVVQSAVDNGGTRLCTAYGFQVRGGATTITLTYSGANDNKREYASEYSGFSSSMTNARVFDTSQTGTGTGAASSVSTLTPARTGNLIIAAVQGSGLSALTAGTSYVAYGAHSTSGIYGEHRLSSAASETAPATITSVSWSERATSFNSGLILTASEVSGAPVEAGAGRSRGLVGEVSGAPVESNNVDYKFGNQSKSSSSWSNQSKS